MSDYPLGSNEAEIYRLHRQHEMFSTATHDLWDKSGINLGANILDLGCGPGFTSIELASRVGPTGSVKGIDQSADFINYLKQLSSEMGASHVTAIQQAANEDWGSDDPFDFIFTRFFLIFIAEQKKLMQTIYNALAPGGKYIIFDYEIYANMRYTPENKAFEKILGLHFDRKSESPFNQQNIALSLSEVGFKILDIQPYSFMATPGSSKWDWMPMFYRVQFPKMIETGPLDQATADDYWSELANYKNIPGSYFTSPLFSKIIAQKQ